MFRSLLSAGLLVLAAPAAFAGELNVWYETAPAGYRLNCELSGAAGSHFALLASFGEGTYQQEGSAVAAIAVLDNQGIGRMSFDFPADLLPLPKGFWTSFKAVFKGPNGFETTPQADFVLGMPCYPTVLDFNYTIGPDDAQIMQAGRVIAEQWAAAGLHIKADNKDVNHPDKAILFDTNNPTGGDDDLGVGQGMALIIAEDAVDANNDGLVDDPDDEQKGGSIYFDFDMPTTVCSVRLVDIDEIPGTQLRFYRDGNMDTAAEVMSVLSLGDGSIQDVIFHEERIDRFEIFFKGSGAVGGLDLIVCPRSIDFDETTLGIPLGFQAGQWITNQLGFLGVNVSALNNHPLHPKKAILFDTANPTGGDDDLMTPNPNNPTNNEALGYVFILAENDVDANNDGLVDDPDDEQGGGQIRFDFAGPTTVLDLKVLDCDASEVDLIYCLDADENILSVFVVPDQPDGSVQTVLINTQGVHSLVVDLGGSGAVAKLRTCPELVSAN